MAGPCVQVYLRAKASPADEARVRAIVQAIANTVQGDDFWIAQRPFFVAFGEPDDEIAGLIVDGWSPRGVVSYCAMCNDACDHVLLGMLCHRTAQVLGGRIALGDLTLLTRDPSVLTFEGTRPIAGHGYVVSPTFLGYWMGNPDFRLMK